MTAPDQPAEHALRDLIRDAIHAANPTCTDYHAADCQPCTTRAEALMTAVVQPVLDAKDAQIARLHAGESDQPGGEIHQAWTPAEWLHWFLRAPADERIATVEWIYTASRHMVDCILDRHQQRIADLTKRAEAAERELATLRDHHHQIGD